MKKQLKYDEIGYWSEVKLDIIKEYAAAYSTILSAQRNPSLDHIYIDAFAGAGVHMSKTSGEFILGSPLNALNVNPAFREYHYIDLDELKIESLQHLAGSRSDVFYYPGDCNLILPEKVLPRARYKDYRRALCILDPYGLHIDWEVIQMCGQMRSIEIFVNFSIGDMNRNILWRNPSAVSSKQTDRMNKSWGDESWRDIAYVESPQTSLFGKEERIKVKNEQMAEAYRKRLKEIAGFKCVPKPMPMRNSVNSVVYYLFFASHKPVAEDILEAIFKKYENRQVL